MRRADRVLIFGGPGPTVLVVLLGSLLLAGLVRADLHEHGETLQEHKDDDYGKLADRLDRVTARVESIEHGLDKRLDPKIRQKARSLEYRLSRLEEDHCDKDHYDCGGQDNECIGRLKVCDGHRDCRNGDDEKHCNLPTNAGDRFIGYKVYDHCDEGQVDKATLIITEIKVRPAFPGFPMLRAVINSVDDDEQDRIEYAYHMVGYYKFSHHKLVLVPPAGSDGVDGLGLVLDFDGHDFDKAVGHIVSQVSLNECAQFVFFREKRGKHNDDDDDDDDDHHHDKHGHH